MTVNFSKNLLKYIDKNGADGVVVYPYTSNC